MSPFWVTLSVPYVSSLSFQCRGVGGIIIVTIVTSFMVVYNSSGDTSSSLTSHHVAEPVPSKKQPKGGFTLEGYTRVVDHQVNEHHLLIIFSFRSSLDAGTWRFWLKHEKVRLTKITGKKPHLLIHSVIQLSGAHSHCNCEGWNSCPLVAAPTSCTSSVFCSHPGKAECSM